VVQKQAVQFRKSPRTRYKFQRLRSCKRCGTYTALWNTQCLSCGKASGFLDIPELVKAVSRRAEAADFLLLGGAAALALFTARSLTEAVAAAAAGPAAIALLFWIKRRYTASVRDYRLQKLLIGGNGLIRKGLEHDLTHAVGDIQQKREKDAYEKLREISFLIDNNPIRIRKIMCLQSFFLRRDMDLELATLIPNDCDPHFISYMSEVAKIKPQLVNRQVIDYVIRYRSEIQALNQGSEVLLQIASSILQVKGYVRLYSAYLEDFVGMLPRDALLRLCKVLHEQHDHPGLLAKVHQTVKLKHEFDPEFQGLI
jgi:hypothetical protein